MTEDDRPIILQKIEKEKKEEHPAESVLALQLFADLNERFDMLLMEVRHLQANLIHSMRFPELHAALRYEESFIFGSAEFRDHNMPGGTRQGGWTEVFKLPVFSSKQTSLSRLAEAFVPVLPVPSDDPMFQMENGDINADRKDRAFPELHDELSISDVAWKDVTAPIVRALRRVQVSGQWTDNFTMNYNVFAALQTLKRNIVTDKLYLAWYGIRAFSQRNGPMMKPDSGLAGKMSEPNVDGTTPRARRADMMIVRAVAFHNLDKHVTRLADFHAQFEKTLDIGSQENHRPITGRRREQGIYHNMLGERARDMFIEISALVRALTKGKKLDKDIYRGMPIFIHRWQHSRASTNAHLLSFARSTRLKRQTFRDDDAEADLREHYPSFGVFAVNTSFWMPDRPDLQPVIAHEAAHCVLMELFGDLAEPLERLALDCPLVDLWRELITTDTEWRAPEGEEAASVDLEERNHQMREILTDILAATITGPGYLFALFQEVLGNKPDMLGDQAGWSEWRDLRQIKDLLVQGVGHKRFGMHWYTRLMVVADVVSLTLRKEERTPLTMALIEGVTGCTEALFNRLRDLRQDFDEDRQEAWREYTRTLLTRVRLSGTLGAIAAYRSKAYDVGHAAIKTGERLDISSDHLGSDAHDEPVRYVNLSEQARLRLIEYLVERKACGKGRALRRLLEDGAKEELAYKLLSDRIGNNVAGHTAIPKDIRYNGKTAAAALIAFRELYCGREFRSGGKEYDDNRVLESQRDKASNGSRTALEKLCARIPIFYRLGDIPWQTALIRAMELRASLGDLKGRDCVATLLSDDYAPGREIMQLGIELWSFGRRSTHDSLAEAVRMIMNLLAIPVSETTRLPGYQSHAQQLLQEFLGGMLATDPDSLRRQLEEMRAAWTEGDWHLHPFRDAGARRKSALTWKEKEGPSVQARERLRGACEALLLDLDGSDPSKFDDFREKALNLLEEALREVLGAWLGSALDADFLELELAQALEVEANKSARKADLQATLATAIERKFLGSDDPNSAIEAIYASVAEASGEEITPLGKKDPNDIAKHLVSSAPSSVWSRLDVNFEIIPLSGVPEDMPKRSEDPERKTLQQTGAFRQLVNHTIQSLRTFEVALLAKAARKLNESKPKFGKLSDLSKLGAAGKLGALQLLKLDQGYPAIVFPLDLKSLCPYDATPPPFVEEFTDETFDEGGTASLDALAHITGTVTRFCKIRLDAIETEAEGAWQAGRAAFTDNKLDQADARPTPLRLLGQQREQRRFVALASKKLEELAAILSFQAMPSQELAPIRSLITRHLDRHALDGSDRPADSALMDGAFRALSRKCDGLRTFRSVYLSRQSLIDTHWWREFGGVDQAWWRERQHAAFYREGPRSNAREEAEDDPERPVKALRQFATLGRYDFFGLSNDMTFAHLRQPIMDRRLPVQATELYSDPVAPFSRVKGEHTFRAFFERREHAVALSVSGEPIDLVAPQLLYREFDEKGDPRSGGVSRDVICILSIRLDRRSSRLGFLERLRTARRHWKQYRDCNDPLRETDLVATSGRIDLGENPFGDPGFRRGIGLRLARATATNLRPVPEMGLQNWSDYELLMRNVFGSRNDRYTPDQLLEILWRQAGFRTDARSNGSQLQVAFEACRLFGDLPMLSVEAAGHFLEDGDSALLGEGWGDIYLIMHTDPRPERSTKQDDEAWNEELDEWLEKASRRLYDIFALQHILFQDHEVHRTEMFLRPVAIPLAARNPDRYTISLSVRSREDRELDGLVQRMVRVTRQNLVSMFRHQLLERARTDKAIDEKALERVLADLKSAKMPSIEDQRLLVRLLNDLVSVSHIPGRNDLEFTLANCDLVSRQMMTEREHESGGEGMFVPLSRLSPSDALDAIHELVGAAEFAGGGGSEEIATRVGFRHLLTAREGGLSFV